VTRDADTAPIRPGKPKTTVQQLVKERGLPLLAARSAQVQGERLLAAGLDLVEGTAKPRDFEGRVLVYCEDSWEALWLLTAVAEWKMARATPRLGQEGAGAKFLNIGPAGGGEPTPLLGPVRLLLVSVNARGLVRRTEAATVTEVQLTAANPGRGRR
jgi:hypothetical protein